MTDDRRRQATDMIAQVHRDAPDFVTLRCPQCHTAYRVGIDAKVTTMDDVHSSVGAVVRLRGLAKGPVHAPDLLTSVEELDPIDAVEEIRKLLDLVQQGGRQWYCHGRDCRPNAYPEWP